MTTSQLVGDRHRPVGAICTFACVVARQVRSQVVRVGREEVPVGSSARP